MFLQKQTKSKKKQEVTHDEPCPDDGPSHDENEMFDSEKTETLSCPSQKLWLSSQEADSESDCERNEENVDASIDNEPFDSTERSCDINKEISLLRVKCGDKFKDGSLITDVDKFKELCFEAGATKLFNTIVETMRTDRQSEKRKELNEKRAMTIICTMMYGQSQQANWYQVALARTLKGLGVSNRGIETLRNIGVAAHPITVSNTTKRISLTHLDSVNKFFETAAKERSMVAIFIDDYHNIHTHHRPSTTVQTQVVHMATLLVKSFPNVRAIESRDYGNHDSMPANVDVLQPLLTKSSNKLSQTYVEIMPDWLQAKYFDPESQRNRLLAHDYQQHQILGMRSMENCKLVDCVELPLKSYENFRSALQVLLDNGLSLYMSDFVVPLIGDWPCQFYVRQVVYHENIHNLVPFIGPLHISLNARENVLLKFHGFFSDMYAFLFGGKRKLARKPKPWRISLLLEVCYGGWLLVRDAVLSVFAKSKDIEFLSLITLLDTYIPLCLSIYAVTFRDNKADLYYDSLVRCWIMFLMFRRRHYDKALLIALSNMEYWKGIGHPLAETITSSLVGFDEYPVENFHSVLRSRTRETDSAERVNLMAREIDARKHELHNFQLTFVPKIKHNFSHKNVKILQVKAAEFLKAKMKKIVDMPGQAKQVKNPKKGQRVVKWKLPSVFGDTIVTNDVLPLGYLCHESAPDPAR